jgi:hypothetical protein
LALNLSTKTFLKKKKPQIALRLFCEPYGTKLEPLPYGSKAIGELAGWLISIYY